MATTAPTILIVDDEPELQRKTIDALGVLDSELASHFKVVAPYEIQENDLKLANLVLVDYKLDEWKQPVDERAVASHIPNGVALATVLRQRIKDVEKPIAFAIHTAVPEELAKPLAYNDQRTHILARINNLDWIFPKGADPATIYGLCQQLSNAVASLPPDWPIDSPAHSRAKAESLLGLSSSLSWAGNAWDDVERSRPPLDELTQPAHGLLFLRWLLQKVLPYPAFLLDEFYLAARLCSTVASVRVAIGGKLGEMTRSFTYGGVMSTFLGTRWWRAGLSVFLREIADGEFLAPDEVRDLLIAKHDVPLEPHSATQPVVCLDSHYKPLDELGSARNSVRILPDEWPHYADTPWADLALATSTHLRNIIIESDRPQ